MFASILAVYALSGIAARLTRLAACYLAMKDNTVTTLKRMHVQYGPIFWVRETLHAAVFELPTLALHMLSLAAMVIHAVTNRLLAGLDTLEMLL